MFSFNPAALNNVPLPPVVGEPGPLTDKAEAPEIPRNLSHPASHPVLGLDKQILY